jgi:hypothetical protein
MPIESVGDLKEVLANTEAPEEKPKPSYPNRKNQHSWNKGIDSPNPGGRPKRRHIKEALMKVMELGEEQLKAYEPKNGYERAMKKALTTFYKTDDKKALTSMLTFFRDTIDGKPGPSDEQLANLKNNTIVLGSGLSKKRPN